MIGHDGFSDWRTAERPGIPARMAEGEPGRRAIEDDAGYYDPDSTDFAADIADEATRGNRKEPVLA